MKTYKWFFLILVSGIFYSCPGTSEEELVGDWQKRQTYLKNGCAFATSFVIGDKGYVIGGWNGTNTLRREMLEFDHTAGIEGGWKVLPLLPTHIPARHQAVGFSLKGKGYMGTGWAYLGTENETTLRDFWQFDPRYNSWEEVAPLPAEAETRRGAIAFSLNVGGKEYGFVGCGYTGEPDKAYLSDFWKFDPEGTTDGKIGKWTPLEDEHDRYRGEKRSGAVVFVIENKAYICAGEKPTNNYDFWMFDPNADKNKQWEKKRSMNNSNPDEDYDDDYGSLGRAFGVSYVVSVGGKLRGHIVGGKTGSGYTNWEYNHDSLSENGDLWVQRTNFCNNRNNLTRQGMISFSFPSTGRAFVGLGISGGTPYDEMWEFIPLIEDYTYDDY